MKASAIGSNVFSRDGQRCSIQRCAQQSASLPPVKAQSEETSNHKAVVTSVRVWVAASRRIFHLEKLATVTVAELCRAVSHLCVRVWIRAHASHSHSAQPPSWRWVLQGRTCPHPPSPHPSRARMAAGRRGTGRGGRAPGDAAESHPRSCVEFNTVLSFCWEPGIVLGVGGTGVNRAEAVPCSGVRGGDRQEGRKATRRSQSQGSWR